jgi:hypothetical protein
MTQRFMQAGFHCLIGVERAHHGGVSLLFTNAPKLTPERIEGPLRYLAAQYCCNPAVQSA